MPAKEVRMDLLEAPLFKAMITNGYLNLKRHLQEVNDLNVFPVPDGDTGSNMGATMSGGVEAMNRLSSFSVSEVSEAMASGMLLSARGNSGVILSQFFLGLSRALHGFDQVNVPQFASAMEAGVKKAYSVVVKPVEGTILTVMREGCEGAKANDGTFPSYFTKLIASMRDSLDKTPELLPVLKEAGVIDSGGAGLVYVVEGMGQAIGGKIIEDVSLDLNGPSQSSIDVSAFTPDTPLDYGYCTEFILQLGSAKQGPERFVLSDCIAFLEGLGDSIVALQEGTLVKVHVHTKSPEKVIEYARGYGEFVTFKMENMTLQHNETLIEKSRHKAFLSRPLGQKKKIAFIAAAPTAEIAKQFEEYGASVTVLGGECMNPSSEAFLEALKKANAETVFVLPNNKNEILVAEQACSCLKEGKGIVIKTSDVAIGIGVASVLDCENQSVEENLAIAENEMKSALSLKIGKTTKSAKIKGALVEEGNYLGFLQGNAVCYGQDIPSCFRALLHEVEDVGEKEVLTVFFGEGVKEEERRACLESAEEVSPFLETYSLDGNQKIYQVLALLE